MILVFAFQGTNSEKVSSLLENDKILSKDLLSGVGSIDEYVTRLQNQDLNDIKILGLGSASKRGRNIRVETKCDNRFRRKIIGNKLRELTIPSWIHTENGFIDSENIGGSYCNLASYKIISSISKNLEYSFLHLPKNLDVKYMANLIDTILLNNYT